MYGARSIFHVLVLSLTFYSSYGQYTKMPPGFDNTVICVAFDSTNNLFYAGGNFHFYGYPYQPNNPINKIAVWNGSNWDSLGSGVKNPGHLVDMVMYNGNLLVGGVYTEIGGNASMGLSSWDGTSWHPVADLYVTSPGGNYGSVCVIEVINNELYVGGSFDHVNGISANGLAKFDGSTWSVFPFIANNITIEDIEIYNNELYVSGNFINGNSTLKDIAKFDGTNWVNVGGWIAGGWDHVMSLEIFQGKLIAGGQFSNASGAIGNYIAAWDGTSWSTLQSGLNAAAISMQVKDSLLYVAGMFTIAGGQTAQRIATWNGTNWSTVGNNDSLNSAISDFAFGNNTLFIGGNFIQIINGDTLNFVAKRDLSTSLFENQNSNENVGVYPNPNNGIFTIYNSSFKFNNYQYEILNFLGVNVFSGINCNENLTINARELNLPSGIYFLKIKHENKYAFSKFIIAH